MTRRRPSLAKQRRLTARPRRATRATGCRWPAISPALRLRRRLMPKRQTAERQNIGEPAADIVAPVGIVIAGDPDPIAAVLQRFERDAAAIAHSRRAAAIVKAVAERNDTTRRVALDEPGEPRQGRRRVVRRQQHAARGEGRTFFQMQIGDANKFFVRPVQRAGRIGDERDAGETEDTLIRSSPRKRGPSSRIPADAGMSGQKRYPLTASPPSPIRPRSRREAYRPPRHRPPRARSPASPAPPAAKRDRAPYGRFGP